MIWPAIIRAITIIFGLLLGRAIAKDEGAAGAIAKAKDVDREKADQIRDRVDVVRAGPVSVRPSDARGYRD